MCIRDRWRVGSVHHGIGSYGVKESLKQANCSLPGIKKDLGRHETVAQAKEHLERAVRHWFAGLQEECHEEK